MPPVKKSKAKKKSRLASVVTVPFALIRAAFAKKKTKPATARRSPAPPWRKKVIIGAVAAVALSSSAYALYSSGALERGSDVAHRTFVDASATLGFTVDEILVTGRERTDAQTMRAILNIQRGDPILDFNPEHAQRFVEKLPWVKKAYIARRLPDTIYVDITERQPLALWQHNKKLTVIDGEGTVLTDENLEEFADLPLVVGEDAPMRIRALIALLDAEPLIAERLDAAIFVGGRRWDLKLSNGIRVRLPEEDTELALRRLVKTQQDKNLLDKNIVSVDLRAPDRLVVEPAAGAIETMETIKLLKNRQDDKAI